MAAENIKAMLAHKYNEDKADYPAYIQPKLDGVRCLFTAKGAFSRAGNQFMNVQHIEQELKSFFAANPTAVLDGELYNHGLKDDFEKIISLVKKKKPTDKDRLEAKELVQYHMYANTLYIHTCMANGVYPQSTVSSISVPLIQDRPIGKFAGQGKTGKRH